MDDSLKFQLIAEKIAEIKKSISALSLENLSEHNKRVDEILSVKKMVGPKGDKGEKGEQGERGKDGVTGKDGKDGEDGATVVSSWIAADNHLMFEMSDGRQIDAGDLGLPESSSQFVNVTQKIVSSSTTGGGDGSVVLPNTGWAQYLDTQYTSISPFVILDGVTSTLPNNAGNNITTYLPTGISLYNPTTQKLTPGAVGDYNAITIRFTAEVSSTSAYIEFGIDTGNPAGAIFRDIKVFPKGAGVEHPFTFTCMGFSLNNFFNNGGIVKITPVGGDVEIYDINYHFARLIPT